MAKRAALEAGFSQAQAAVARAKATLDLALQDHPGAGLGIPVFVAAV